MRGRKFAKPGAKKVRRQGPKSKERWRMKGLKITDRKKYLFEKTFSEMEAFDAKYGLHEKAKKEYEIRNSDIRKPLATQAAIISTMQHYLGKLKGKKILQIAASSGNATLFLQKAKKARAFAIDLNIDAVKFGQKIGNKRYQRQDAANLKFRPNSMDAVIIHNFLTPTYFASLVNDNAVKAKTVNNSSKVLKKGGFLFIQNIDMTDPSFYRKYLENAGFKFKGHHKYGMSRKRYYNADILTGNFFEEVVVWQKV